MNTQLRHQLHPKKSRDGLGLGASILTHLHASPWSRLGPWMPQSRSCLSLVGQRFGLGLNVEGLVHSADVIETGGLLKVRLQAEAVMQITKVVISRKLCKATSK